MARLSQEEWQHYRQQIELPGFGLVAQQRLKESHAVCAVSNLTLFSKSICDVLVESGVGRLSLIPMIPERGGEWSDYTEHLRDMNRFVSVAVDRRPTESIIEELARGKIAAEDRPLGDMSEAKESSIAIIDATGRANLRHTLNRLCVRTGMPFFAGGVWDDRAWFGWFAGDESPCLACNNLPISSGEEADRGLAATFAQAAAYMGRGVIRVLAGTDRPSMTLHLGNEAGSAFVPHDMVKDPHCSVCSGTDDDKPIVESDGGARKEGPGEIRSISALELKKRLEGDERFTLLDVREPGELEINRIPGSTSMPLGQVERRVKELPEDGEVIVYCKVGGRSALAAEILLAHGISRVSNLEGGIVAWVRDVEPDLPSY